MEAGLKIAITGVCASGKSLLAENLQRLGFYAYSVAQEHSEAPRLWQHRRPDFLVVLDATMETIRTRRDVPWGEERLVEQRRRLAHAREHCNLYLPTDDLTPQQVTEKAVAAIEQFRRMPRGG